MIISYLIGDSDRSEVHYFPHFERRRAAADDGQVVGEHTQCVAGQGVLAGPSVLYRQLQVTTQDKPN